MNDPILHLKQAPPLHPDWITHESSLPPPPPPVDIQTHKKNYLLACITRNQHLLSGRDHHLTNNITITDQPFTHSSSSHPQIYRKYTPSQPSSSNNKNISVIYYHGGGLFVGDLDSEDLTCRRICLSLEVVVYSCEYRTMPDVTANECLEDALALFRHLSDEEKGPFVLVGSSSGGQLAGQVSQEWLRSRSTSSTADGEIKGVILRCPVTCNPSTPSSLPENYRSLHTSLLDSSFHNSVILRTCVDAEHRTTAKMPLEEEDLKGMPGHWIQLCTNDLFYSDGACYVDALRREGVEVRTDVLVGWPHTFWLKHGDLDRAVKAEADMLEGLKWLIESA